MTNIEISPEKTLLNYRKSNIRRLQNLVYRGPGVTFNFEAGRYTMTVCDIQRAKSTIENLSNETVK